MPEKFHGQRLGKVGTVRKRIKAGAVIFDYLQRLTYLFIVKIHAVSLIFFIKGGGA